MALSFKGSGKVCVSIQNDGDLLYTAGSLWTAAHHQIPLLVVMYNNRSYYNDEDHQERIALWRDRPVGNKGIGIRIEDPEPDFASLARSLGVAGFGPVTNPNLVGEALDVAIAVVKSGKPAVIDVHTQAR